MQKSKLMRSFTVLLAVVVMFTFTAMTAFAAESGSGQSSQKKPVKATFTRTIFQYTSAKDGTAVMNKAVKKKGKKSVIVYGYANYKGIKYKVVKIKKTAFKALKKVKVLKFDKDAKNIKKIEKGAFKSCKKLKTIKISKKMTKKQYKKLVKLIKAAGYKGKITRY